MEGSVFLVVLRVFGGLALFLLGMSLMTEGLRGASGSGLRRLLASAGANRVTGLTLGTVLGLLVHSSAATSMLVAFVNAGLTTLEGAAPAIFGANIGTTLNMQLISFDLGKYAFLAITLGVALRMGGRTERTRQAGNAILGFGMLFLGMSIMSDSIRPYRDTLRPLLMHVDASTVRGMLFGVALSLGITLVIQSSGATIGMCFALTTAGVFTDLAHAYPIVLGAHVGTCATALLASLGTHIEARRTAVAHLLFNIILALCAMPLAAPIQLLMQATSDNVVRQTANLHTFLALAGAVAMTPLSTPFVRLVRLCTPSRRRPPENSHLDPALLPRPEEAIFAAIRELRRVAVVCSRSLRANGQLLLLRYETATIQQIRLNERVIDEIKLAMRDYLQRMTRRYLSRRQAMLVQHLDRCIVEIERIGDHIDYLCDLSLQRRNNPETLVHSESFARLFELFEKAQLVLTLVIESLDPNLPNFQDVARKVLAARDEYVRASIDCKASFDDRVASKEESALAGLYYSRYIAAFDRIVKHAKTIALAEQQPTFWIKRKKLGRIAPDAPKREPVELGDPTDYAARLHAEDEAVDLPARPATLVTPSSQAPESQSPAE